MKLSEYNRKRDFDKTAEPEGKVRKSGRELHFVVQKHDASSLHFDFRLEIDGVLVSWAVPKGPSADAKVKRLAMHVEDHPMDYINFEGIIPQGEYGGGTVMVWDTGTFVAEGTDTFEESEKLLRKQLKEGSIKVVLNGNKLKGAYHIVQMKGKDKQWLLLKGKDEFADGKEFGQHSVLSGRTMEQIKNDKNAEVWESNEAEDKPDDTAIQKKSDSKKSKNPDSENNVFTTEDVAGAKKLKKFPDKWKPQLATLTNEVFDNDDWIFENKLDGYRTLIQIKEGTVNLISRNTKSFNDKYPELVKAFENIQEDVILDGEVVVEDSKGQTHFQWLQYYKENPGKGTLKCYVFDILYFNGYDLTGLELLQRKRILEAVLPQSDVIVYSRHIAGKGTEALKKVTSQGGEGLIAKIVTGKYKPGSRSEYWLKIKVTKEQEMVIGGFTEPQGTRRGFGALLIGYYKGDTFIYAGKVGTGFNNEILSDLHARLEKIEQESCPFTVNPKQRNAHWVKPVLVAQIKYSEWTETGSMRHPVFIALRNDKKPTDVKREISESLTPEAGSTGRAEVIKDTAGRKATSGKRLKNKTKTSAEAKNRSWGFDTTKVEITNPDKVFWPKEGITKGDVLDYYDKMAEYLLPFVINRPQSLRRTPDGIKTPGFFQKNVEGMVPNWIKTRKLKAESTQENVEFLLCNDKDTLMFMANWGCIEINPWSSRVGSINNPDYIIFDLDPNKASIKNLVATAKKVKEVLDSLGIKGYLKTSGGKGLHVFIPVKPEYTYGHTREFSHIISQFVVKELPEITSLERNPDKRKGKVYLDFLQNGKGKTMACAYSLRPREGATASTPLDWDELTDNFDMKDYNIKTLPERVKHKGDLWADFFDNAIDLKEVLNKLK